MEDLASLQFPITSTVLYPFSYEPESYWATLRDQNETTNIVFFLLTYPYLRSDGESLEVSSWDACHPSPEAQFLIMLLIFLFLAYNSIYAF